MKKINLILFAIIGMIATAGAANPVTMTDFHRVYNYLTEVNSVLDHGVIDGRIMPFMMDENTPIDQKAAVINALVVKNTSKSNALTFKQFISRNYGENWESPDLTKFSADDLFCLGYMMILDADGNSEEGTAILEMASRKAPNSLTINTIYALALAQNAINSGNACEGWKAISNVKSNTNLNSDLNTEISNVILREMEQYNEGC